MRDAQFIEKLSSVLEQEKIIAAGSGQELKHLFRKSSQEDFDLFLLQEGLVSRQHLLQALSLVYHVPSFDVLGDFFDHSLLIKFPKHFLMQHCCIPLEVINDEVLIMITSRPDNEVLTAQIGEHVSYAVEYLVGIESDILVAIEEYYDPSETVVDNFDYMDEEEEKQHHDLEHIEEE